MTDDLIERATAALPDGLCGQSPGCNAASICLCSVIEDQRETLAECVARIATQQEAIDELVEGACELLEAMTVRALRGRDNVPAMRDEQGASMHLRALLSKHGQRT